MEEKFYTRYDNECIVYLALEILKLLMLESKYMFIDVYYDEITKIYEDYKKEDDATIPLLTSIENYINKHEQEILKRINIAFNGCL